MMNFFNLTLSEKHFIFPSILNDSFAGYSNLYTHIITQPITISRCYFCQTLYSQVL